MRKHPIYPAIIDIEASSLSSHSYPIEVGVALGKDIKFCSLIRPLTEWTDWCEQAEKTHMISRQDLEVYGKTTKEVASQLNQLLKGQTLYSDGWQVDKSWLTKLFYAARIEMQFQVSPLEMILSEKQMNAWHETKEKIIAKNKLTRHRASTDAWIIQQTYIETAKL